MGSSFSLIYLRIVSTTASVVTSFTLKSPEHFSFSLFRYYSNHFAIVLFPVSEVPEINITRGALSLIVLVPV